MQNGTKILATRQLVEVWKGKKAEVATDSFGFNLHSPDKRKTADFQNMEQNFGVKKKCKCKYYGLKNAFPVLWEYFACMICSCINVYTLDSAISLLEMLFIL